LNVNYKQKITKTKRHRYITTQKTSTDLIRMGKVLSMLSSETDWHSTELIDC